MEAGSKEEAEVSLRTIFAETPYVPLPTAEERASWAERRHLFWRNRSLDHARTIDRQLARTHELLDTIKRLEKVVDDHRALLVDGAGIMDALMVKSDCSLDRNAEFAAVAAWKARAKGCKPFVDYPLEPCELFGSNPNPPECDPRA
jgi:hypothetical protein